MSSDAGMTIDKAIELLNGFIHGPGTLKVQENRDAIKLGIEALKRIQHQRCDLERAERKLLLGEALK